MTLAIKIFHRLISFKNNPRYVGRILVPDKFVAAKLFFILSRICNFVSFWKRRQFYLNRYSSQECLLSNDNGYAILSASNSKDLTDCIDYCNDLVVKTELKSHERDQKKSFMVKYRFDLSHKVNEKLEQLATSDLLIAPISKYIGSVPVLGAAEIWYSLNDTFETGRSQEYHIDNEDVKQVKCFIPLEDVFENSGPLTLIPAKESRQIYDKLTSSKHTTKRNYKLSDEIIYKNSSRESGVKMIGNVGDIFFVDTCNCYHYGSRPSLNGLSKPRLILYLHYYSAFSREMPLWGRSHNKLYLPNEEMKYLVFGLSYCHYPLVREKLLKKVS